jgi:cytochrome c5
LGTDGGDFVSASQDNSSSHDKHFFDTFMLVLGILVAIAFGLYVLSRVVAANTQEKEALEDPISKAAALARIEPAAKIAVAGQDNSALEAPKPAAAAALVEMGGDAVFNSTCVACHGAGIAGAPKFGDKAAWKARIAEGIDTLHKHAIEGYQGGSGVMPPKGGRTDLSDKSIMSAVDYMVNASK